MDSPLLPHPLRTAATCLSFLTLGLAGAHAATTIPIPFDTGTGGQLAGTTTSFGTNATASGPQQLGTSGWYGRANAVNQVTGGFTTAGYRPSLLVNTSTALGGAELNFLSPTVPSGMTGQELPEMNLWKVFSQTTLAPNTTYTLTLEVDSGSLKDVTALAALGFGIGMSTGASSTSMGTFYADSLTSPSLLNIELISGTQQRLTFSFTTGSVTPGGDIGFNVFAGRGTQLMTGSTLADFHLSNASLQIVPEPGAWILCGLGALAGVRRRR
ncbi:MAG: hypothetical protein QM755_21675 [Luteolibacter sp.]